MFKSIRNYFRRLAEGSENGKLSSLLQPLLSFSALLYQTAVTFLRSLYERRILKSQKLPFPVISVGNLTWGGTGKTPLVEYLARRVSEIRKTPLILTRGYNPDEVKQMHQHLPRTLIGVGKDRAKVAIKLAAEHPIDIAILDDGLQHWPVARDLEIVMINALNPFGNGRLVPEGILREPLCVLRGCSFVVLSHSNLVSKEELENLRKKIRESAPQALIVETELEPLFFYRARKRIRVPLEKLKNRRITTFSGVGSPRSFQKLLLQLYIRPVRNFEFGDHHAYTAQELREIKKVSESASTEDIVTTEKDFYRAPELMADVLNPLILATRLRIVSGEQVLMERISKLIGISRN